MASGAMACWVTNVSARRKRSRRVRPDASAAAVCKITQANDGSIALPLAPSSRLTALRAPSLRWWAAAVSSFASASNVVAASRTRPTSRWASASSTTSAGVCAPNAVNQESRFDRGQPARDAERGQRQGRGRPRLAGGVGQLVACRGGIPRAHEGSELHTQPRARPRIGGDSD